MAAKYRRNYDLLQKEIENGRILVEYAEEGDADGLRKLIEQGVSVDAEEYNKSLFYASKNYMTPLQWASRQGHSNCVQILIECGADLNAKDRFDVTSVHLAAESGHLNSLKALLNAEADCNIPTKYSKYGSYIAQPHVGGTTPLHLAATTNHVDCVRELILNGADYNAADEFGRTSLFIAAELGYEECLITHLKNAIGRDILSLPVKDTGETPLHECVRKGLLNGVKELLKHGSDANHMKCRPGCSPLHLAVQCSDHFSFDIVKELVQNGYNTDINLPDSTGLTPLHYACFSDSLKQSRRPALAAFLIAYGADHETIKDKHGRSLLKQEFQQREPNPLILHCIINSSSTLPSLESIGQPGNVSPNNQQIQNERILFARSRWYQTLSLNPRSLQHSCRCTIRRAMGAKRLKYIPTLPLPKPLQDFLLLRHQKLNEENFDSLD